MAIEIVDFPIKNGGSFHSYVTVYQRVRCKISNVPPLPSGRKRHLGGVHIVQGLAHLFRMRLLPVNFKRSGDLKTLMFSWWILMVWSPAKKYLLYVLYIFIYSCIYWFIYSLFIYLFIHYLFIYFIYTGKNNYINCAESMVPGHGWKKHVQPPKPQYAYWSQIHAFNMCPKTAIRWMVCSGVNPIILPKIAIDVF